MIKTLEKSGRTEDDAIAAALRELGLDRDDVSVEIIERAKAGFLGIGASPAVVRVSYEAPDEVPAKAEAPAAPVSASPASAFAAVFASFADTSAFAAAETLPYSINHTAATINVTTPAKKNTGRNAPSRLQTAAKL